MKIILPLCLSVSLLFTVSLFASENENAKPDSDAVVLQKDSKILARYRVSTPPTKPRPFFKSFIDELRTHSGKNVLLDSPDDHIHHHGLMFAIKVNSTNFWEEFDETYGKQVWTMPEGAKRNYPPHIIEQNYHWITPEAKILLFETRIIAVDGNEEITILDWQSSLKAVEDVLLGDGGGHYYGLGLRFVREMDKDGRFFNSTGKNDGEVVRGDERLTPCKWMAYTATLEGKPVTVAVFDSPSNQVPMTAFTMGDVGGAFAYLSATMNFHRKPVQLRAGQTFMVKYRVAVWDGEAAPEIVEKKYQEFIR